MTWDELFRYAEDHAVEFVDLRWADLLGREGHCTLTVDQWRRTIEHRETAECIVRSPQVPLGLAPVCEAAVLDPFGQHPTLALRCEIRDRASGQPPADEPRAVARRAAAHWASAAAAQHVLFTPTLEFFIFDGALFDESIHAARYVVESREGVWRRGRDEQDNLGTQIAAGAGDMQLPPADSLIHLRCEIAAVLGATGVPTHLHAHGPATGGHTRIGLAPAPLVLAADRILWAKYVVRNVAARYGKVATFMPHPLAGQAGSAMPTTLSPVPTPAAATGQTALSSATTGLARHAGSLHAFTRPTTNSYRRAADSAETPTWTQSAATAIEFGALDAAANPYLAFSALLLAMLDGLGPPSDSPARVVPSTLEEALAALEVDRDYLTSGGVFSPALIDQWIDHKWRHEIIPLRQRPHPHEFGLYFSA